MFNTAANGKTYEAYSDTNGNYIIYDQTLKFNAKNCQIMSV